MSFLFHFFSYALTVCLAAFLALNVTDLASTQIIDSFVQVASSLDAYYLR